MKILLDTGNTRCEGGVYTNLAEEAFRATG